MTAALNRAGRRKAEKMARSGHPSNSAAGQVQIEPRAMARLMREVRAPDNPEPLTERETDVLRLLAQGQSNKEIAHNLSVSEKTVKSHVSSILRKLDVPSRTQAALYAVRQGLVSIHSSEQNA